jgi:hypothetical protein
MEDEGWKAYKKTDLPKEVLIMWIIIPQWHECSTVFYYTSTTTVSTLLSHTSYPHVMHAQFTFLKLYFYLYGTEHGATFPSIATRFPPSTSTFPKDKMLSHKYSSWSRFKVIWGIDLHASPLKHTIQNSELTPGQPTSLPLLVAEKDWVQQQASVISLADLASISCIEFGSHKSLVNKVTGFGLDGWGVRTFVCIMPSRRVKQNILLLSSGY